jgi:hypothetical protein
VDIQSLDTGNFPEVKEAVHVEVGGTKAEEVPRLSSRWILFEVGLKI